MLHTDVKQAKNHTRKHSLSISFMLCSILHILAQSLPQPYKVDPIIVLPPQSRKLALRGEGLGLGYPATPVHHPNQASEQTPSCF